MKQIYGELKSIFWLVLNKAGVSEAINQFLIGQPIWSGHNQARMPKLK